MAKCSDRRKYIEWYNIAKDVINNEHLIPLRTDEEILDLVSSRSDWIIFCQRRDTRELAKQKDEPNVYLKIRTENGSLNHFAIMGIAFENIPSYRKFKKIFGIKNSETKDEIIRKLSALDDKWKTKIKRKIQDKYSRQVARYSVERKWKANQVDKNIINEMIRIINNIRERGKHIRIIKLAEGAGYYFEGPSINLLEIKIPLKEEEFRKRVSEAFDVLSLCR